ncbi:hypothetical protein [Neolewinella persica]|uniref:hypothetical protein n=1 Tax=Neolewinella persica TaxID=70998 RepID=UPI000379C9B2|nr:hypothetical protein [Neolewinella persica]
MRLFVALTFTTIFLTSCFDDQGQHAATVEGHWELVQALRNNTETEMLDGLHFDFMVDGKLKTNLLGNETEGTYVWADQEIVTEGVKLPLTYNIQELTDTTMHLRSRYQGFQFDFKMKKAE